MTNDLPHGDPDAVLDLFPPGSRLDRRGELLIGGCRSSDLAAAFGTPTLIVNEAALRARARRYVEAMASRWPNSLVVWASKSLPHTAVYGVIGDEGLGVDVSGGGEIVMALAAEVDPETIVFHGNAKTDNEISMAVEAGVGLIVVDNLDDIDRLEQLVTGEQAVLVRVTPDVHPDVHPSNAVGHAGSKFGMSGAQVTDAITRLRASDKLRLDGLHVHIGSQIVETESFARSVDALADLGPFPTYDFGGGLGARYTYSDQPPTIEAYADVIVETARRFVPENARLLIEPGRSMVAEAGVTLYRVVTVKRGAKTLVAVDGGMSDNLEVSLYGQRFEATMTDRVGGGELCTLVGRHCESGDVLIDGVELREPCIGDIVAVPVTGAYCLTMANNYNGTRRLPIVFVSDGVPRMVLRRETYADLLRRDVA